MNFNSIGNSTIFPTADQARVGGQTYLIVHEEVRAIETAILFAMQSSLYTAYITGTTMTNVTMNSWQNITSINTSTSVFTLNNHGYQNGDEVQFTTAGTLPSPVVSTATYFIIVVDSNNFQIAATYINSATNIPLTIITVGSGTIQIRALSAAQDYYAVWQGTRNDRGQTLQMNETIQYFTNLGYDLVRQTNPNAPGIFWWICRW